MYLIHILTVMRSLSKAQTGSHFSSDLAERNRLVGSSSLVLLSLVCSEERLGGACLSIALLLNYLTAMALRLESFQSVRDSN